jgi:hypothetical protein
MSRYPRVSISRRVADGGIRFGMDGTSELDPGVNVSQGRDEQPECGGEPLTLSSTAAKVDQRVAAPVACPVQAQG